MKTIRTTGVVTPEQKMFLEVELPDISPGEHRVVLVVEDSTVSEPQPPLMVELPVHDAGLVPPDFSLRREDIYGDIGR